MVRICFLRQQQLFFERNEDGFPYPSFKVQAASENICRKERLSSPLLCFFFLFFNCLVTGTLLQEVEKP